MRLIDTTNYTRLVLQKVFGFDRWHCASIKEREYIEFIVEYLNYLIREKSFDGSIVEIGGGLGDIIANVEYSNRKKILCDLDLKVIVAGKLLYPRIHRRVGSFDDIRGMTIGALITVNFLSSINHEELERILKGFINNNRVKYWFVDSVQSPPYAVEHDFEPMLKQYGFCLRDKSKGYRAAQNTRRHILVFERICDE